jgi:hypothetical protein
LLAGRRRKGRSTATLRARNAAGGFPGDKREKSMAGREHVRSFKKVANLNIDKTNSREEKILLLSSGTDVKMEYVQ